MHQLQDLLVSGQAKEKSCRSVVQDLTKMQLGGISSCTKKLKFKNGKDKSKKMNVIYSLILKHQIIRNLDCCNQIYMLRNFIIPVHLKMRHDGRWSCT